MALSPHLLVFGPGYTAKPFISRALEAGWQISATYRRSESAEILQEGGITPIAFPQAFSDASPQDNLKGVTHILSSIAPPRIRDVSDPQALLRDPVAELLAPHLGTMTKLRWVGYLSATSVYGDHGGAWVDETTPPQPSLARGVHRLAAESAWVALAGAFGFALHIFRLAGIYGPGRNPVRALLDGRAQPIDKPGHFFSRIHVADIAEAVWLAANSGLPGDIFNVADDHPSPQHTPIELAARALGLDPPPLQPYEKADLSVMARSFYSDNKRVRNARAKEKLGLKLRYPTFADALADLIADETV